MKSVPKMLIPLLAVGGGLLYLWVQLRYEFGLFNPSPAAAIATAPPANAPTHEVTATMVNSSDQMLNRRAEPFSSPATDGKTYALPDLLGRGPVLLTFNKVGCPCSVAAQPMFNQLAAAYPRATVLGVVDAESGPAGLWSTKVKSNYPQLLDPALTIVRAYGAENSVYVVLIDSNGRIVEHWPGISAPMMREVSSHLARLTGSPEPTLRLTDLTDELASGCPFDL